MLTSFRFWGGERDGDSFHKDASSMPVSRSLHLPGNTVAATSLTASPLSTPVRQHKRSRPSFGDSSATDVAPDACHAAKRVKVDAASAPTVTPTPGPSVDVKASAPSSSSPSATAAMDKARDIIHYQFGHEILLKHNELRLINQELAKCQVALEQLRRCHLIPYPVTCPTPDQMLEVASGKGPAVRSRPGEAVPQWAPPYGVVDGPYARHYAKWLIPDPKFDGMQPEWHPVQETGRAARVSAEGRTTRNSVVDLGNPTKPRPARGMTNHKLQSLSHGYPQPKEKAGPCILKRSDGQTVKLVCLDCHRDNFSSTQGFINHCRIAHRRDFKSHEEAAVHCGHVIEVNNESRAAPVPDEKEKVSGPAAPPPSGLVHPFAQAQLTDQQAYVALLSRINASLDMYHQGKLPGVTSIPTSAPKPESKSKSKFKPTKAASPAKRKSVSATDTPFLSSLMKKRNFRGNLDELVSEATQKVSLDDMFSPAEDSEETDNPVASLKSKPGASAPAMRAPVVVRVPARTAVSSAPQDNSTRPKSSKGTSPPIGFASPPVSVSGKEDEARPLLLLDEDVDMDAELSPNTLVSNNAPSLVSDDGEYDDSDDGSSVTGDSDNMEAESVSDVAEINIEEDNEPRSLRHHRTSSGVGSGTAMRLKKDENTPVTLVNPVNNNAKRARKV